ncbi:MAG: hypothetical protein GT597_13950 [Bacteroidales bacterium]|nr:hypothetical protein [Bacteroidales bacterium]
MRSLIFILLSLLAASCATQEQCLKKWPPLIMYRDTVLYRDTTFYVFIPPDTVFGTDTVIIINYEAVTIDTMILETDYAITEAWVADSRIYQRLFHKPTAIELKYDSLLQEKVKIITVTNTIREKPRFNGVLWQIITLAGIILLIILAMRLRSGWP